MSIRGLSKVRDQRFWYQVFPSSAPSSSPLLLFESLLGASAAGDNVIANGSGCWYAGAPPTWAPPAVATELDADSGLELIDSDRYHDPMYPLEPMFLAVLTMEPEFTWDSIDLVTDAENLVKLFGFIVGGGESKEEKRFRIQVSWPIGWSFSESDQRCDY